MLQNTLPDVWRSLSPVIATHVLAAGYSLLCGLVLLSLRKGTPLHRVLGGSWVGAMLVTALGSFWIQSRGHLSWIHLLSGWTVLGLAMGMWSLWRGRVQAHRQAMRGLMVGLTVAFVFTLTPDRLLGRWLWHTL